MMSWSSFRATCQKYWTGLYWFLSGRSFKCKSAFSTVLRLVIYSDLNNEIYCIQKLLMHLTRRQENKTLSYSIFMEGAEKERWKITRWFRALFLFLPRTPSLVLWIFFQNLLCLSCPKIMICIKKIIKAYILIFTSSHLLLVPDFKGTLWKVIVQHIFISAPKNWQNKGSMMEYASPTTVRLREVSSVKGLREHGPRHQEFFRQDDSVPDSRLCQCKWVSLTEANRIPCGGIYKINWCALRDGMATGSFRETFLQI